MVQGKNYNEPFFWHRIVNVGWGGGWGVLAVDMPENQNIVNEHGFFPIGPFVAGDTLEPSTLFVQEDGRLDKFNWLWFVMIEPLPPVLETLYEIITEPAKDRWIIDAYINAPAERNDDQEAFLQASIAEQNIARGYSQNETLDGQFIRFDPETSEDPSNPWAGTGDYPAPATIYKKLNGSSPGSVGRQYFYWWRYLPLDPVTVKRKAVRLTYLLNFAGGPPAFEAPEAITNISEPDEHLPAYTMKFKLDIYRRNVVLTVNDTTLEGPTPDRTYSETREASYTAAGTVVTIAKTGFV